MSEEIQALDRFVVVQQKRYPQIVSELKAGSKEGHWMWFVFPQIDGLSTSKVGRIFAISDDEEALAYLNHSLLGARLRECVQILLTHAGQPIFLIFNEMDALKFHASMTLFASISEDSSVFHRALDAFFEGARHEKTLALL